MMRTIEQIINHNGNPIFDSNYTSIREWKNSIEVMIREDAKPDRYGLIDRDGNEILPCKYNVPWNGLSYEKRRMIFIENEKCGVMDFEEKIIIPANYDEITGIDSEFLHVGVGEKNHRLWGLLTEDGAEVLPLQYDSISVTATL